jgi:hypothetical protein
MEIKPRHVVWPLGLGLLAGVLAPTARAAPCTPGLHPPRNSHTFPATTTHTTSITGHHPLSYTVWELRTATERSSARFGERSRAALGSGKATSAALGDVNGDGSLDVLVAKGRYGPQPQEAWLNQPWIVHLPLVLRN